MSTLDELAEGLTDERVEDVRVAIRAVKASLLPDLKQLVEGGLDKVADEGRPASYRDALKPGARSSAVRSTSGFATCACCSRLSESDDLQAVERRNMWTT